MTLSRPTRWKSTITRLEKEIASIDDVFYSPGDKNDPALVIGMLERKRDDMVRSVVLQMHTAIEDILDGLIACSILGIKPDVRMKKMSTKRGRAVQKLLHGAGSIGFDMKLNLALSLRIVTSGRKERLMELNTLRNKCSHNWLLKVQVRRGKRPAQKKPPLLLYRNRDLHKVEVLREFTEEYSQIYLRLFLDS